MLNKRFLQRFIFTMLCGIANLTSTGLRADEMTGTEKRAQHLAEKFVAEKYPDFDKRNKKPFLTDLDDRWEFTYELPDDMIGGAPVVVIDKQAMRIVHTYRTQ